MINIVKEMKAKGKQPLKENQKRKVAEVYNDLLNNKNRKNKTSNVKNQILDNEKLKPEDILINADAKDISDILKLKNGESLSKEEAKELLELAKSENEKEKQKNKDEAQGRKEGI